AADQHEVGVSGNDARLGKRLVDDGAEMVFQCRRFGEPLHRLDRECPDDGEEEGEHQRAACRAGWRSRKAPTEGAARALNAAHWRMFSSVCAKRRSPPAKRGARGRKNASTSLR